MSTQQIIMLLFKILGGLSLFIYGMHIMTGSLRIAAGSSLRRILARATSSRLQGFAFGMAVGFLAHTGAAITMLAGFINAGVMTLGQSIAPIFGANVGTSLSMQLVSFHIASYCWVAIGIGFLVSSLLPSERWKKLGDALIGFGLLFLGMDTISSGIAPHKEALSPILAIIRADTWTWRLVGVGLAAVMTALLTSSGAMIGLCFALLNAGAFSFEQAAVVVLGAHIGTCIVPIMASFSMKIGAWRAAIGHLLFNIMNVILGLLAWPWFIRVCQWSAPDNPTRQLANMHTLVMLAAALLLLPFIPFFTRLLLKITPSKEPDPLPSFLDNDLLSKPEQALVAVIKELRRMAEVCVNSMMLNGQLILEPTRRIYRQLISNEEIINEVRRSMEDYLNRLTRNYLSRRQTLFLQHLDRCIKDIERIGDHLTHIGDTSIERYKDASALLPEELFKTWFELFCSAKHVLVLMARSFDPNTVSFQNNALEILRARDIYMIQSMDLKADLSGYVRDKQITPVAGYYLNRYIEDLDRLVRRAKSIALAERQPDFGIKQTKLSKKAKHAPTYTTHAPVAPSAYLALLQKESIFDDDMDMPDAVEQIPVASPYQAPPDEGGEEPPAEPREE